MDGNPRMGLGGDAASSFMLSKGVLAHAQGYGMSTLEDLMSMFVRTRTVTPSVAALSVAAMSMAKSVLRQNRPHAIYLPSPLAPTTTIVAPVVVGPANIQFGLAF